MSGTESLGYCLERERLEVLGPVEGERGKGGVRKSENVFAFEVKVR